jgi:hypothetical protein
MFFFHPALIILKNNSDAAVKTRDSIPIAIITNGFPLRKTGTASNSAFLRISPIIRLTIKIPKVKPKESVIASIKLFAIFIQTNTDTATIPSGKLINVSLSFLYMYVKIKYSKPLYKTALTGNKSTYTKIPENLEKITSEKNSHIRIIEEKIILNLMKVALFKAYFDSTILLIPRPQCNIMFMVNPE